VAAKLKNLKIRKVDFVDEGANPDAHIGMMKRKGADAHVPEDRRKKESGNVLKKLFGLIGKAAGIDQGEIDSVVDEIQKGDSVSFHEKINEVNNRKIADEMWDICYALQSSLCSILNDEELDSTSTAAAMQESLGEFMEVAGEAVSRWSAGNTSGIVKKETGKLPLEELEILKAARDRLSETIDNAVGISTAETNSTVTEGETLMEIDKSRLTDAERAFLESIEKRCGTDANGNHEGTEGQEAGGQAVNKSANQEGTEGKSGQAQEETDSIYKGLHPAVAAELAGLQKFKQAAEEKELSEVAKKYAIIGKKEEELVPLFKSLKAAGGTAYDDMVAVLDQAVETVEKSGAFSEIGKSGRGGNENSAEAKISNIAKSYMEKNPSLGYQAAVAKAWEDNPGLLAEYDGQAGF